MRASSIIRYVIAAPVMLACLHPGAALAVQPVRAMSFNIRYGTANDGENAWPKRKQFLADTIQRFDPHILGTQETLAFQRDEMLELLPGYEVVGVGRDDRTPSDHAAVTAVLLPAARSDWMHWRGDGGNGVSLTATPPVEFGPERNLAWSIELPGRGSSSPVVVGDMVFVTTAVPVEGEAGMLDFRILCLDRATGRERWSRSAVKAVPHERTHETNGYASASPCTDGERVYAHFGSRGLHCYAVDGEHVWSRDFGDMIVRNGFGEGSSPTVAGDFVVVPWDHEGPSMLYAVAAQTGETVWEVPRDEPTCWATPLVIDEASGVCQVVMNGQHAARGYELATGKELWRCGGQTERPVASAVAADGVAYVGSGFRGAFLGAFDISGRGDLAGTDKLLWTTNHDTPDVASPLLSAGRLCYYKEKTGLLTCLDARTGTPHYETKRVSGVGRTYASPVAADGHIYLTDRSGRITVIRDAAVLEVLAENDIGEGIDATPSPAGDSLFVRGERRLFRFARQ